MTNKKPPLIHHPHPVHLPDPITRDIIGDIKDDGKPLDETDRSQYDDKFLFYDVFFARDGSLCCIGPPFLNIGEPLAVRIKGGRALRYKIESRLHPGSLLLRIEMNRKQLPLYLEISFIQFKMDIPCPRPKSFLLEKEEVSLITLQKDNPIQWIKDWCIWHKRAHNIRRVFLYDNGSENFSQLNETLAQLDEDMEFILVHWPFKYGPTRSARNSYSKTAFYNHYRLFFGANARWCVNLDIDEYLYTDKNPSLAQYLAQPEIAARPVVYLGSYLFPHTRFYDRHSGALIVYSDHYAFPDKRRTDKQRLRFYHHHKRYEVNSRILWGGLKYMCQPQRVDFMENHFVRIKSSIWKQVMGRLKNRIRLILGKAKVPPPYYLPILLPDREWNFCFFHFKGLHTGWRGSVLFGQYHQIPLVSDHRLTDKAIELGMIRKRGKEVMDEAY